MAETQFRSTRAHLNFITERESPSTIQSVFAKEDRMIARIWHGYTKPEHANAYESMLKPELLPGISKVKGYRGSYLLRRELALKSSSSPSCFGIRLTQSGPWQGRIMKRLSFPKSNANIPLR